jgi:hypothetical protein
MQMQALKDLMRGGPGMISGPLLGSLPLKHVKVSNRNHQSATFVQGKFARLSLLHYSLTFCSPQMQRIGWESVAWISTCGDRRFAQIYGGWERKAWNTEAAIVAESANRQQEVRPRSLERSGNRNCPGLKTCKQRNERNGRRSPDVKMG